MFSKIITDKVLYFGYGKETYTSLKGKIDRSNLQVLKYFSITMYFAQTAEAIFLCIVQPEANIRIITCFLASAISLLFFFFSRRAYTSKTPPKPNVVNILIFFTSLFYYLISIFLGTFLSINGLAVLIVLMLAILQIVFIIQPLQNMLTVALVLLVFIFCDIISKENKLAASDAMNAITSTAIGSVMSWSISKLKLENMISSDKLRKSNYDLYHESISDPLTGLNNRKMTFDNLENSFVKSKESDEYLTCISIDVDHFKEYNRFYGRSLGDRVLVQIGKSLSDYCKAHGYHLGRIGGGEFMVLFNSMSPDEGEAASEDLRKAVEALDIPNEVSRATKSVTISLGLFTDKTEGYNFYDEIYTFSDRALYRAKEDGKNRVWKYIPEIYSFSPVEQSTKELITK